MAYVSTLRIQIKPGTAQALEQLVQERLVPLRRALLARGDVLFMAVVRAADPADHYELITHWASQEAHDRNEDSPAEREGLAAAAAYLAAPPAELRGVPVVELGHRNSAEE